MVDPPAAASDLDLKHQRAFLENLECGSCLHVVGLQSWVFTRERFGVLSSEWCEQTADSCEAICQF